MLKFRENFKYLLNVLLPIVIIVLLFIFLPRIIFYFFPLFLAFVIAIIADKIVSIFDKKYHLPRKYVSAFVVILLFALITFVLVIIFFGLYNFITDSIKNMPNLIIDGNRVIEKINRTFSINIPYLNDINILRNVNNLSFDFENIKDIVSKSIKNVANIIIYIAFTLIFAYVLLTDSGNTIMSIKKKLPKTLIGYIEYLKKEIRKIFYGWFKAQIFCVFLIMLILFIGFVMMKVKYAFSLAVIIAIVDALPIFGSGLFLWPWGLVALLNAEYKTFFILAIIYALIQIVRSIIQNKYMQAEYKINGVATLIIIFLGYKIYGFAGLIFSLPIGMFFISLYNYGIFDDTIYSIKMLFKNIKSYLKLSKKRK